MRSQRRPASLSVWGNGKMGASATSPKKGWQYQGLVGGQLWNAGTPNPAAWTDLDASVVAGIGNRRALLMLGLDTGGAAATVIFWFRRKDQPGSAHARTVGGTGCAAVQMDQNRVGYAMIHCDGAGLFEWWADVVTSQIQIWVEGFILL